MYFLHLSFPPEQVEVDAGKVITRFPQITRYSVDAKFKPMMDYFVDIGLRERIKPRCEILLSSGLLWTLNCTLSTTETAFTKMLRKILSTLLL
ncbi:unnamed protein product [Sphagnum jensenii]